MKTEPAEPLSPEPPDFSLILGGPLFQLLRRAHLSGDAADLVWRRVIALALITWLPLLALSIAEGHAWGDSVKVPFLLDVDVHARFLLALPLLIVAELVVHQRMRLVVGTFVKRGLVPDEARGRFDAAIAAAMRLRNSVLAEVLLIALVYGLGVLFIWRRNSAMDLPTWYGMTVTGKLQPTLAGWWFGCVSLPLIQFILLRWYFRLLIWTRFLWQVSRIDLRLVAIHPDRAGGLGFLSTVTYAFAPLLAGQGVTASRRDGEQDLLRRREADRLQVGTPRDGDNDAFLRARAAAGVHPAPGSHQAHRLGGIRRARPALRARV